AQYDPGHHHHPARPGRAFDGQRPDFRQQLAVFFFVGAFGTEHECSAGPSGRTASRDCVAGAACGLAVEVARDPLTDIDHGVEIDARFDAHAVKHVEHVFGGNVTRGALGVGAAAQACHRGVIDRDTRLKRCQNVCQGLTVGVVEVAGDACGVDDFGHRLHDAVDPHGRAHADCVGNVDLVAAQFEIA